MRFNFFSRWLYIISLRKQRENYYYRSENLYQNEEYRKAVLYFAEKNEVLRGVRELIIKMKAEERKES